MSLQVDFSIPLLLARLIRVFRAQERDDGVVRSRLEKKKKKKKKDNIENISLCDIVSVFFEQGCL